MKPLVRKVLSPGRNRVVAGTITFLVAAAGILLLMPSSAASPVVSLEVETGDIGNGSIGGPQLTGTRVGLRSDLANYNVDNIVISR